jgi:predicted transcriptional regulator
MFLLKGILRAESQEKVLIYLLLRGSGYGKEIAEFYGVPANPVQKQLARLETDGVIVGQLIGKVRSYELSPRYVFLEPLKALLKSAMAAYPPKIIEALLVQRTRPRLAGKPLLTVQGK